MKPTVDIEVEALFARLASGRGGRLTDDEMMRVGRELPFAELHVWLPRRIARRILRETDLDEEQDK